MHFGFCLNNIYTSTLIDQDIYVLIYSFKTLEIGSEIKIILAQNRKSKKNKP